MRRCAISRDNVLRVRGAGSIKLPGKQFKKQLAERLRSNSF